MTRRVVAVAAPVDATPLALAMLEDVVDLVEAMREVEVALAVARRADPAVREATWPTTPLLAVDDVTDVVAVLDAVEALGADEAAVVAADAPDLPALLLGKLHSALTAASVALCPAADGSLVALAARLPVAPWLRELRPSLRDDEAVARVRASAPPRTLVVGSGWHRVRSPADVALLDPGLEGWEATRALLAR